MFTWLLRYIDMFGKEFPVSAVKDKTEYEIVRMIQECCISGKEYSDSGEESDDVPLVGKAKVGESRLKEV